ncbi:S1C family serine protease [Agaribacterium sp. ZY112]|uniref:S1C family serine protease n=1 Tax=Agaribacterium sp. ZY112 TaxID=3233574 RepID=UPI0035269996
MYQRLTLVLLSLLLFIASNSHARDFSKVYAKVKDSVVTIHTTRIGQSQSVKGKVDTSSSGLGSGVLVRNGYILTAAHVVQSEDEIEVQLADKRRFKARTVSSVSFADLAVIKLEDAPKDLPQAKIGNSDNSHIGEEVFVIGSPYGVSQTLTIGHLSGRRNKQSPVDDFDLEFLQTDAPINQGNSGGPLFNVKGEVIGIVSHILSQSGGNEGLGFAASINMAKGLFLDHPPVWTGMTMLPLSEIMMNALNVPYKYGILVEHVAQHSLGHKLGVQGGTIPANIGGIKTTLGGDVIVAISQNHVNLDDDGIKDMWNYLRSLKPGDKIELNVIRQGQLLKLHTFID